MANALSVRLASHGTPIPSAKAVMAFILECPAGQILVNQECRPAAGVAGKCGADTDCVAPFTFCKNGICDCVPGATRRGADCFAGKQSLALARGRKPHLPRTFQAAPTGPNPVKYAARSSSTTPTSTTTARIRIRVPKAPTASLTGNQKSANVARSFALTALLIYPNRAKPELQ